MEIYNSKFTLPPFHTSSRQPKSTLDSRNEWEEAKENVQIWSPAKKKKSKTEIPDEEGELESVAARFLEKDLQFLPDPKRP